MMDDACQTKVGAGAKCAPTISLASNNFSVTTCIAAGQKVSPASSADISKKQSDLSTGAIAGISISALVLVATVAIIVIAIVKRQASRQRNQSIVAMESMAEVQVDQAVLNPAAPAQCSADIDPTFVEVPVKTPSSAVIDPTFVEIPANAPSSDDADPTFVEVPANAQSSAVIDPTFVEVLANAPSSDDVDPTLVEVPSNEHPLQGLNVAATSLNP
jgi:Na+-transporting NADH:ubiquinone oxidoreductase subunit NqrC